MNNMKTRYRLTYRGSRQMFYCVDKTTGKRTKGTNLSRITQAQCGRIVERLKNRPGLRLGFKASNEAYY
jgi:hypothetical protein